PQLLGVVMAAAAMASYPRQLALRAIEGAVDRPGVLPEGIAARWITHVQVSPGPAPAAPGKGTAGDVWWAVPAERRWALGGSGFYGSTTALRIAEADIVDEVVMVDIIEDKPQGLALDMMQSRPIERFETRIVGSNSYDATAGSDVCVITAGLPRKPGMSRMD